MASHLIRVASLLRARLMLELSNPMTRCFKVVFSQAVPCLGEMNCHICACATKEFGQTFDVGRGNNRILITSADPHAYIGKIWFLLRMEGNHCAKQDCSAQQLWPQQ
jgi:hypothetical protein